MAIRTILSLLKLVRTFVLYSTLLPPFRKIQTGCTATQLPVDAGAATYCEISGQHWGPC